MKTYQVRCWWSMCKIVEIDAESPEEAMKKAEDTDTEDGEYLDGSFEMEIVEEDS